MPCPRPARVSCYAGYRADQEPRSFAVDGREYHVADVVRRWREPDLAVFIVMTDDGERFELRHDRAGDTWTATSP